MKSLGFVARASLRESGLNTRADVNPIHMIALEAAERAYAETYALLEAEQEGKWKRRAITAAKIAGVAGGSALIGMGGLGAIRGIQKGKTFGGVVGDAYRYATNPLKIGRVYANAAGNYVRDTSVGKTVGGYAGSVRDTIGGYVDSAAASARNRYRKVTGAVDAAKKASQRRAKFRTAGRNQARAGKMGR